MSFPVGFPVEFGNGQKYGGHSVQGGQEVSNILRISVFSINLFHGNIAAKAIKYFRIVKILIMYFTLSWISLCPGFWPKIQDNVMDTKNIKINIYFFKFNNTY